MFKFLKDKLSKAVGLFSKKVEDEAEVKEIEVSKEESLDQVRDEIQENDREISDISENAEKVVSQNEFVAEEELEELEKELEEVQEPAIVEPDENLELVSNPDIPESDLEVEHEEESFEQALLEKEEQNALEQARLEQERKLEEEKNSQDRQRELALQRRDEELAKARLAQEEKERQVQEHKKMLEQKQREEREKEKKRLEEEKRQKELEQKARLEEERRLQEEEKRRKELEEKEKNKGGFFKKLFSKSKKQEETKKEPKPVEIKPRLILEKEEYDEVKEDYMLASETEEELEALPKKETKKTDEEKQEPIVDERKGFFEKIKESITTVKLSEEKFDEIFWDLELAMLENNVAVEVIEKIKADLKEDLTSGKVSRSSVDEIIHDSLKKSIEGLFAEAQQFNLIDRIRQKSEKPYIISFIGVNGAGKTTTMAKVAHLLLKNNLSVVFAASDTFRAAAMQQLQEHADKLGVKMIKHDYESDPAAVAFDAIKHAQAKQIDVVLIDTAGRLHTNDNLMNELKKLIRVNKPDMKIFIGEAITGNDCVEQAKLFNEMVGLDAIILAKADIDEKGGAALSVSYVTKKPILYLGTGQTYDDLEEFDAEKIIENIGL